MSALDQDHDSPVYHLDPAILAAATGTLPSITSPINSSRMSDACPLLGFLFFPRIFTAVRACSSTEGSPIKSSNSKAAFSFVLSATLLSLFANQESLNLSSKDLEGFDDPTPFRRPLFQGSKTLQDFALFAGEWSTCELVAASGSATSNLSALASLFFNFEAGISSTISFSLSTSIAVVLTSTASSVALLVLLLGKVEDWLFFA
mmetsp:Transcript_20265/g.38542  ORF Transcript_20265/g.38542 Transcript_20265/m.38542 type:complete len:204 (-) Transcript_20265:1029-1640(-)